MATKKQKEADAQGTLWLYMVPLLVVSVAFTWYHFAALKRRFVTGPHVRRVFDLGSNYDAVFASGLLGFLYGLLTWGLYGRWPASLLLTIPLGFYVLNWMGRMQARAFLGVVVDYQQGRVFFPATIDKLDITDVLKVTPVLQCFVALDDVALLAVQRISRRAGKELFLHGDFGSRRITFSDKLKRDECIHLITSRAGAHVKVVAELE